jgi:hypothetical protein
MRLGAETTEMHWIDPNCLPETTGVVDCFLLNTHGETDGFVLADGTEVHVPPHMGAELRAAIQLGSAVRVRGVRPRDAEMVAAVSVQPEGVCPLVDNGPPDDKRTRDDARKQSHAARSHAEIHGVVRRVLHGPKGELRGVLF